MKRISRIALLILLAQQFFIETLFLKTYHLNMFGAVVLLGKRLKDNLPASGGTAQQIRVQVGNCKALNHQIGFCCGQCIVECLRNAAA